MDIYLKFSRSDRPFTALLGNIAWGIAWDALCSKYVRLVEVCMEAYLLTDLVKYSTDAHLEIKVRWQENTMYANSKVYYK